MLPLNFPKPDFSVRKNNEQPQIFDRLRKLWVKLTPEEWVRQNVLGMMLEELNFPAPYISIEKEIQVGQLKKRFDLLIYDASHRPWMLVECKAPEVALSQKTAEQMLNYQQVLQTKYMVITNGNTAMGWEYRVQELVELHTWPAYNL
jgi:hypothetical protein